jgi:hypothetical protein
VRGTVDIGLSFIYFGKLSHIPPSFGLMSDKNLSFYFFLVSNSS